MPIVTNLELWVCGEKMVTLSVCVCACVRACVRVCVCCVHSCYGGVTKPTESVQEKCSLAETSVGAAVKMYLVRQLSSYVKEIENLKEHVVEFRRMECCAPVKKMSMMYLSQVFVSELNNWAVCDQFSVFWPFCFSLSLSSLPPLSLSLSPPPLSLSLSLSLSLFDLLCLHFRFAVHWRRRSNRLCCLFFWFPPHARPAVRSWSNRHHSVDHPLSGVRHHEEPTVRVCGVFFFVCLCVCLCVCYRLCVCVLWIVSTCFFFWGVDIFVMCTQLPGAHAINISAVHAILGLRVLVHMKVIGCNSQRKACTPSHSDNTHYYGNPHSVAFISIVFRHL